MGGGGGSRSEVGALDVALSSVGAVGVWQREARLSPAGYCSNLEAWASADWKPFPLHSLMLNNSLCLLSDVATHLRSWASHMPLHYRKTNLEQSWARVDTHPQTSFPQDARSTVPIKPQYCTYDQTGLLNEPCSSQVISCNFLLGLCLRSLVQNTAANLLNQPIKDVL